MENREEEELITQQLGFLLRAAQRLSAGWEKDKAVNVNDLGLCQSATQRLNRILFSGR